MAASVKTIPTLLKQLAGRHHAHGCAQCNLRYTDCCNTPGQDGRCITCRGGRHGRALWDENADPVSCCRAYSREVTIDQRARYDLAGTRSWWICQVCARTHPYMPVSVEEPAVGGPA